jgi:2-methylfumaryl-CoA isomerase
VTFHKVDLVLSEMRVVELSAFVAAPLAGATLGSLGAEVIRIEQRGGGIDAKRWPLHDGRSLYREGLDRGKRSVTLDLRSERGREIAAALITAPGDNAGFFLTNLSGPAWASFEALSQARPDLVMVSIGGTPDGRAAVDYTVNAGVGFPLVTGPEDVDGPVNHVLPAWDVAAGLLCAVGVLVGERHRAQTGEGQLIDLALSDVALSIADRLGFLAEARLVDEPRPRLGNDLFGTYGRNFRTRDGRDVMVAALTPRQWQRLTEATELADAFAQLATEANVDLRDESARYALRREISALLALWFDDRTFVEVSAALDAHGVLWGPYRTFKELVREDPRAASLPATPLRFSAHANRASAKSPRLGADTEDVLRKILDFDQHAIDELRADGVID